MTTWVNQPRAEGQAIGVPPVLCAMPGCRGRGWHQLFLAGRPAGHYCQTCKPVMEDVYMSNFDMWADADE